MKRLLGYGLSPQAMVLVACTMVGSETQATPAELDKLVAQWLQVEQQTQQLEQSWREQKPLLAQRAILLEREIAQLEGLLTRKAEGEDAVASERASLAQEQTELEQAQRQMTLQLAELEATLADLAPQLPPPLALAWQQEAATLAEGANTSERLQVALAKLAKLQEFDQRISVHHAPLTNPAGEQILVAQLYLGAGQAWFVSPDGKVAGSGRAEAGRWQWQFDADVDGAYVSQAIRSFEQPGHSERVPLPVQVKRVSL